MDTDLLKKLKTRPILAAMLRFKEGNLITVLRSRFRNDFKGLPFERKATAAYFRELAQELTEAAEHLEAITEKLEENDTQPD